MSKVWWMTLALVLAVSARAGELELSDAWVRALPPVQKMTAAYLTVTNTGATEVELISGSSPIASTIEIHTSRMVDGYMRMEQLPGLKLAPGESTTLEPGGTHLMLLSLNRMPTAGDVVKLCLTSAEQEQFCTEATTRKSSNESGDTDDHAHHH
ncbi:MAG: copper chaperone PCu(A)C [Halioglobus sp.]